MSEEFLLTESNAEKIEDLDEENKTRAKKLLEEMANGGNDD